MLAIRLAIGERSTRKPLPQRVCACGVQMGAAAFFHPAIGSNLRGPAERAQSCSTIPGGDMYWLYWLFILSPRAAAARPALLAYRTYVMCATSASNFNIGGWLFRQRPEPRLGVIEQASVDARRKLVLIRRDGVEHLIMTGGPVDVVIETGIEAPQASRLPTEASAPVFTRQPRSLGQAGNE